MPAPIAALEFSHGMPSLHCPATGRLVVSNEEGLDPGAAHSPHLRFVLDALGSAFVVDPAVLPAEQATYQQQIVRAFTSELDQFEGQRDLVAACAAALPSSGIVIEMTEPAQGSSDGWVAYFGFDLAPRYEEDALQSVSLVAVERFEEGYTAEDHTGGCSEPPDPRVLTYGYFASDQFGVGQFRWFADPVGALFGYVRGDLEGGLLEEDEELIAACDAVYTKAKASGQGLHDVMVALNTITDDYSTIQWCGRFESLCNNDEPFASDLRTSYRELMDDEHDEEQLARPVSTAEIDDFVKFLAEYGY